MNDDEFASRYERARRVAKQALAEGEPPSDEDNAVAALREACAADLSQPQATRAYQIATCLGGVADLFATAGDLKGALSRYEVAIDEMREVADRPDAPHHVRFAAWSQILVRGGLKGKLGDPDGQEDDLLDALARIEAIVVEVDTDLYLRNASVSANRLTSLYLRLDPGHARVFARKSVAFIERLWSFYADGYVEDALVAYELLQDVCKLLRDGEGCLAAANRAAQIAAEWCARQDSTDARVAVALACSRLAAAELAFGEGERARPALRRGVRALWTARPGLSDARYAGLASELYELVGREAARETTTPRAVRATRLSAAYQARASRLEPDSLGWLRDVGVAYEALGLTVQGVASWDEALDALERAEGAWREAFERTGAVSDTQNAARVLMKRARLLLHLGEDHEAARAARRAYSEVALLANSERADVELSLDAAEAACLWMDAADPGPEETLAVTERVSALLEREPVPGRLDVWALELAWQYICTGRSRLLLGELDAGLGAFERADEILAGSGLRERCQMWPVGRIVRALSLQERAHDDARGDALEGLRRLEATIVQLERAEDREELQGWAGVVADLLREQREVIEAKRAHRLAETGRPAPQLRGI